MLKKSHKPKAFNYRSMIRSAARRIWMWSPMRKEAIRAARIGKGIIGCNQCKIPMKENAKIKQYRVDHPVPASEPTALILSFDDFFKRLFEPSVPLQILCINCHNLKTANENMLRPSRRKDNG